MAHNHDAIVIGGGLAGLTAATHMARAGNDVVVLDARARLGGRATTDERNGYLFNQGGHALYNEGPGMTVLRRLGITPQGAVPPSAGIAYRGGQCYRLPAGAGSLLATRLLPPRAKVALGLLLTRLPRLDSQALAGITVSDWLDGATSRDDVRKVVEATFRLTSYANAPDLLSAGAAIGQLQMALASSVMYLHGGWQQLVDALTGAATDTGAVIEGGQRAATIVAAGDGWSVGTGDRTWTAAVVIIAGPGPAAAAELLGSEDAFAGAGPAVEAAVLDLSLAAQPTHRFGLGIDEPLYFSVHGPPAHMAPDGAAAAVAMKYLPHGRVTGAEQDRADLDEIASACGATDVVDRRFLRRMTVTNGMPLADRGGLLGRPPVEVPSHPGVFVAGDWVGAEGLLADAALASGRTAGRMAAAYVGATAATAAARP